MLNQDLIDLIIKPENLPWALEIEAAMWDAKTQLLRRFWRAVAQGLEARLAELNLATLFHIAGSQKFEADPRTNYDGVCLVERAVLQDRPHLRLGVFHEDKMIFPGAAFSHQQSHPNPNSEVHDLCHDLPEQWRDSSDWWVGWYDPGHRSNSDEFLRKLAQDAGAVADSMTEELAVILRDHCKAITDANRALQAAPMT
jgi:hypothetical protein